MPVLPSAVASAVPWALAAAFTTLSAQDRLESRSMVMSQAGVVATESMLASQVGARMLESGGNAIDAAVAANAIMGLVAPMNDGVGGWDKLLKRFGRKSFADLLAPAIAYAEAGFPVGEVVDAYWRDSEKTLKADAPTAETFLIDGRVPGIGEVFDNRDLAATYCQIVAHGRDGFYKGEVARQILRTSSSHGGTMAAGDLAEYDVYELPPNGQGVAALEMLNIMEGFPLAEFGPNSVRALHAMIEAKKIAYADMLRYDADPKFAKIPVVGLTSKEFATARAKLIDPKRANCRVDRDGNIVSLIQSNYATVGFGSGLAVGRPGFALQNRGGLFTLDKSHPNVLAGRKRPVHTIIPAFMEKGDLRIVDHGMNVQGALDAARFSKETFPGCDVNVEARIPRPLAKSWLRSDIKSSCAAIIRPREWSPARRSSATFRRASTSAPPIRAKTAPP
jgi:gamma-glutamyltranspeptidase/glutathione hydrolase